MSQPKDVGAKKTSGRPGPSRASRKRNVTADSTPCQSDHPGRGLASSWERKGCVLNGVTKIGGGSKAVEGLQTVSSWTRGRDEGPGEKELRWKGWVVGGLLPVTSWKAFPACLPGKLLFIPYASAPATSSRKPSLTSLRRVSHTSNGTPSSCTWKSGPFITAPLT